jgi:hypothetical protein
VSTVAETVRNGVDTEKMFATLDVLAAPDREVVDAVPREARTRGADEIVLADPRGSGLGGRERRQLRRRSAIPVASEPVQDGSSRPIHRLP